MTWQSQIRYVLAALADATPGSALVMLATVLTMTMCRQPARRLVIGRAGLLLAFAAAAWNGPLQALRSQLALPQSAFFQSLWLSTPTRWSLLIDPYKPFLLVVNALALSGALVWIVLAAWGTRRILRSSVPASAKLRSLHRATCPEGTRSPRLVVSERVDRPLLLGFLRPVIVLPAGLEDGSAEALRLALIHEHIHISRHDQRWAWLGALAQAFWFYFPMSWWIRAQLRLDEELLTDHESAGRFGSTSDYASALLAMAPERPDRRTIRSRFWLRSKALPPASPALVLRLHLLMRTPFPLETRAALGWKFAFIPCFVAGALVVSRLCAFVEPGDDTSAALFSPNFCITSLTVGPSAANVNAPSIVRLLEELPDQFELNFEIENKQRALSEMRILEHRFETREPHPRDSDYLSVRIVRDAHAIRVWVEGAACSNLPRGKPELSALMLEAPKSEALHLRNLRLRAL